MASFLYDTAKQSMLSLSPSIDYDGDTIEVALCTTATYTSSAAHDFFDDITRYVGTTDQTLASKTVTGGVFDAANITYTAVVVDSGRSANALVMYKDTGTAATSPVIAYIDGFSVLPNGGDVTISWDDGTNRIFKI